MSKRKNHPLKRLVLRPTFVATTLLEFSDKTVSKTKEKTKRVLPPQLTILAFAVHLDPLAPLVYKEFAKPTREEEPLDSQQRTAKSRPFSRSLYLFMSFVIPNFQAVRICSGNSPRCHRSHSGMASASVVACSVILDYWHSHEDRSFFLGF